MKAFPFKTNQIRLKVQKDESLVKWIKQNFPDRKYYESDKFGRFWVVGHTAYNVSLLKKKGFKLYSLQDNTIEHEISEKELKQVLSLKKPLYPTQIEGINLIDQRKGNVIIGDPPRAGKTLMSLAWTAIRRPFPVLIICPPHLRYNWESELTQYVPQFKHYILEGMSPHHIPKVDFVISSYNILHKWKPKLLKYGFQCVIMDESHYFKNNGALRTLSVVGGYKKKKDEKTGKHKKVFHIGVANQIPHKICITGTAILSRPIELWNSISLIDPDRWNSWFKFGIKYCNGHKGFKGWDFTGASNTKELHKILKKTILIRRTKQELGLPDEKQREAVIMDIDNRPVYKKAEDDIIQYLREIDWDKATKAERAEALVKMATLKKLAAFGKLKWVIDWLKDFIEDTDEKILVFAHHKEVVSAMYNEFKDISVLMTGGVTSKEKKQNEIIFNTNNKIRIMIATVYDGYTPSAAENIAFIEYPPTPGIYIQAEDRTDLPNKKTTTLIYNFVAKDTIETDVINSLHEKAKIVNSVLDGKTKEDDSVMAYLVKSLLNKHNV